MLKDAVVAVDVGSSKITALIGENGINNNFVIRAHSETECFSLVDGEIDEPDKFSAAVKSVFSAVESSARARIEKVYFSVPGDFMLVKNVSRQMYLNRRKRLKKRDVNEYILSAKSSLAASGYELICHSGVQYLLDGEQKVTSLTGRVTSSINGMTSFFFAKTSFTRAVRKIMGELNVKEVVFVPVPLAEAVMLFDETDRFAFEILVDVGAVTTSFSIIYGGGVLYNTNFATGGGYINGYLMQKLNLSSYELAEKIKRKLNLTLPVEGGGVYEVSDGDEIYRFSQKICNDVAAYVITDLAENIDTALKESKVRLPADINISMTGGGIAYIRGAREYLFSAVEIPVNVVCPSVSYMAKPEETSKMAVLNFALNFKGV